MGWWIMSKNTVLKTLLQLTGERNVITVHRSVVGFLEGHLEVAIMFEQLLYWTPRSRMSGWIAKSDAEFQDELCLKRHSVRSARMYLEGIGIVETKKAMFSGAPTTHYKINMTELECQWGKWVNRLSENEQSSVDEDDHCLKTDNPLSENKQSLTETTTETTKTGAKKQKPPRRVPATVEEAIYSGQDVPEGLVGDNEKAKAERFRRDAENAAWIICQGQPHLDPLAMAFMLARQIILPYDKKSQGGHRKALKAMYEAKPHGVRAEHVKSAVETMLAIPLMVKDLFSVQGFAIEAANPPPDSEKKEATRPELKPYQEDGISGIPNPKQSRRGA